MSAPQPVAVCPHCQHSNPAQSSSCENCHKPITFADDQVTQDAGEGWSVTARGESLLGAMPALAPGRVLGDRYEILQELGQGGMGSVYKARDRELDRIVALKVIRPELAGHPKILQRFKQELILARQVTHKNVIRIFDLASADGLKYITMEYIEGHDLTHRVHAGGKLSPDEAIRIMRQVCRALDAAHTEGVIHRDLKPQNIMVDSRGKVSVMDFGLARSVEAHGLTQTGAMLGTPAYMSPEQAKAQPVDARSDLFAFGIIFYELLSGTVPFQADTILGSLLKRTQEPPPPLATLDPNIPQALSDVVQKCLAIDPAMRYQSAAEILADLDAIAAGQEQFSIAATMVSMPGLQTVPAAPAPQAQGVKPARRRKPIVLVSALAVLMAASAVFVLRGTFRTPTRASGKPMTVLVADFENHTGDPIFDGTLEPMLNVALEGASFINAYNRGEARKAAAKLPRYSGKLDEQTARLVAVSQGVNIVISGALRQRGNGYKLSVEAMDAVTGTSIASKDVAAPNKDAVLLAIPKLAVPVRTALGDTTPESVQLTAAEGTFTASSLEAVHQYGIAMEQQFAGKMQDAFQSFSRAAELDPNFARAYFGMATTSRNLRRQTDAEKYFKLAMEHVDRMTERERYRTRGTYYVMIGNFQKCVEEYGALINQFPSDNLGHANLAICQSHLRNMPQALSEARRAVEIAPKSAPQRMNLSLYASYAGDFQTAEREARSAQQLNPAYEKGYLTLAYAQVGQGQLAEAAQTYQQLAKISAPGASLAASGLADLALYEGRFSDAARILENGAAADLAAASSSLAPEKFVALAYSLLVSGQKKAAENAAERALQGSKKANIRFLAGRILLETGSADRAQGLAAELASELNPESQVYGKLLDAGAALAAKDPRKAIQLFTEANGMLDTWIGRFDLGRAYLEAGLFTEADSEFDRCLKRRGEALELDDGPTFGYFPPVYYYQGRVREGLKSPGFAESYQAYLKIRSKSREDQLVTEIHRRLNQ